MRRSGVILLFLALSFCSCQKDNGEDYLVMTFRQGVLSGETTGVFLQVASNTSWTLSFEGGRPDWITSVSTLSGTGNNNSIVLSFRKNETDTTRHCTLVASSSQRTVKASFAQKSIFEIPPSWLELPAGPNTASCRMYSHFYRKDGKRIRNFSYCYDRENRVSLWVAYPLNRGLRGSGTRKDTWGIDPNVPVDEQPFVFNTFKDGSLGWRCRGHQCPSADRYDVEANIQTFYGTNITPQLNDYFNSTIWAHLEGLVRGWSYYSDTLYVVTGCVLGKSLANNFVWDDPSEYNKRYGTSYVRKKVNIPTAYYKAAILYSKTGSEGFKSDNDYLPGRFMGIGVYMDHKDYNTSEIKFKPPFTEGTEVMSIDALEKKLGYDLFASLPEFVGEDVAAKVEADDPTARVWWSTH